ncbi:hypothetical protein F7725_003877 [Dissostichus mawsoni]|uniref:Uncharacterized protein n=1 Tax=Dissostichus mawsoni TaxID=36200 RepID=A0A7J5YDE3_DISMA|nr:hypothetical protein F7725_003877 [Dissostichus mawsoni]
MFPSPVSVVSPSNEPWLPSAGVSGSGLWSTSPSAPSSPPQAVGLLSPSSGVFRPGLLRTFAPALSSASTCFNPVSQLWCCSARSSENFCSCSLIWSLSCWTSVSQLFLILANLPALVFFGQIFRELFLLLLQVVLQLLDFHVLLFDIALVLLAQVFFGQVFGELFLLLSHLVFQLFDIRLPAFVVLCQIIVLLLHLFQFGLHVFELSLTAQVLLCQVLGGLLLALKEFFLSSLQQVYGHQVLLQLLLVLSLFSFHLLLQSAVCFLPDCHTLKEFISSHHPV